jgi:hypothetical protein
MGPVKLTQNALSTLTPRITVAEFANALLKRWVPQRRGRDTLGQPSPLGRCYYLVLNLINYN